MGKGVKVTMELLEKMVGNACQWLFKHNTPKKTLRVNELDVLTTLSSQVAILSKQVSSLTTQTNVIRVLAKVCDLCEGSYVN